MFHFKVVSPRTVNWGRISVLFIRSLEADRWLLPCLGVRVGRSRKPAVSVIFALPVVFRC